MYNYLCPQCGKIVVSDKATGDVRCGACGCQFNAQFAQQAQPQQNYGPYQQQRGVFDNGPRARVVAWLACLPYCSELSESTISM